MPARPIAVALAAALTGCTCAEPPAPPAPRAPPPAAGPALPDLVVITLDTTRADRLGIYGWIRDTSPTLDALARESLVFDHLVVPMATTLPTHTSLFTATWPEEHGVLANVQHGGRAFVASPALVPFATWAQSVGYTTAAFTSAAPLDAVSGIQAGFGTFDAPAGPERKGAATVERATSWLAAAGAGPVLLWVHLYDPHNPWTPDPTHAERFAADDPAVLSWMDARRFERVTRRPSGEVVRARPANALYDAELRTMDDAVARLLDAVRARGRWDDTAFVVMGDHGESLNQHGEPGHGLVWMEQVHAPLWIKAPGLAPGRTDVLLSAADVLPTLLGRVELPEEPRFLAHATGVDVLAPGFVARPVLSQTSARQAGLGKPPVYALTWPDRRCVWTDGVGGARHDLVADPYELAPAPDEACVAEVQAVLTAQRERGRTLGAGGTAPVSPERQQELCALGYTEGCDTDPTP